MDGQEAGAAAQAQAAQTQQAQARGLAGRALANAQRMGLASRHEALPYCRGRVPRTVYFVFFMFILVFVLTASSIGVLEWFSIRESATWNADSDELDPSKNVDLTETYWYERTFAINGGVKETLDLEYGVRLKERFIGNFMCRQITITNVWRGDHRGSCDFQVDQMLTETDPEWHSLAASWCDQLCRGHINFLEANEGTTCGDLERYANEASVSNKDAAWNEKAICSTAKGIFAGLILALVMCVVGAALCFCCTHRLSAALIPGALTMLLCAIVVIVYGVQISSTYPWQAHHDFMQLADQAQADTAKSEVARIQGGFALAISASALAMGACLVIISSMLSKPAAYMLPGQDGVAAAVPLQMPAGPIMLSQPGQLQAGQIQAGGEGAQAGAAMTDMDQAGAATAPCWLQAEQDEAAAAAALRMQEVLPRP